LVLIEAMACGTPVIAFNRGSVPEIIEDGLTGFVVEGKEEAVAATRRLSRLSRRAIRQRFEERFTSRRMAREYLMVYRTLIEKRHTDRPTIAGNFVEKTHSKNIRRETNSPHPPAQ
jgi:glycosyltransferase involved in cell wall biosynthesis